MADQYWVIDGSEGEAKSYSTELEALEAAEHIIEVYRECCDPEWPLGVGEVVIVFGSPAVEGEGFDYAGMPLLYRSTEVDRVDFEPGEAEEFGCDYSCDYKMVKVQ